VTVAVLVEPIGLVFTVKVALVLPAGTVIEAGVAASVLLLARATTVAPVGAAPANETVPVTELPPITLAGAREMDERVTVVTTGVTLRAAVLLILP
jgi:hypothetical protein